MGPEAPYSGDIGDVEEDPVWSPRCRWWAREHAYLYQEEPEASPAPDGHRDFTPEPGEGLQNPSLGWPGFPMCLAHRAPQVPGRDMRELLLRTGLRPGWRLSPLPREQERLCVPSLPSSCKRVSRAGWRLRKERQ